VIRINTVRDLEQNGGSKSRLKKPRFHGLGNLEASVGI
jgi:hypothetical protein